ncbi:MAG: phosphoglycerate dehydrogenase [Planctomycetes bacterium]|nr:phosphoglycerate dehydrogenase [Planctomycetota bacterium]
MPKVLIADEVAEDCARILREAGIECDHRGKMKPEDLKLAVAPYEGLIVRSAVKVTKEIVEAGRSLKIVGRAGIGVDNIDQEAATRRGIIVMNAPLGNVTAAAEHALALLLANARNVARADASMRAGRWERSTHTGVQLEGKTLGIVGLGKIGGCMAAYGKAFHMRVVAYDPLLVRERAEVLGVQLLEFDKLLAEADFVTIHVPLNERTKGMFGAGEFARMKKTARLVNTSRGGIVDEKALHEALLSGQIAGAALDVFENEPPPKDLPLLGNEKVTLTPHLAASTQEAQLQVAIDIAHQFVDYFRSGVVRNATNLASIGDPSIALYVRLAEDLGSMAVQLSDGGVRGVEITYMGQIAGFDVDAVTQAAVKGVLHPALGDEVTVVNARLTAKERGVSVAEERRKDARNYKSQMIVRVETDRGGRLVAGTLFEGKEPRITQINTLDIDLRPSKYMLFIQYPDVPGVVGKVGTILGNHGINIARMEVGRTGRGQQAAILLTLDDAATAAALEEIRKSVQPLDIRSVVLS